MRTEIRDIMAKKPAKAPTDADTSADNGDDPLLKLVAEVAGKWHARERKLEAAARTEAEQALAQPAAETQPMEDARQYVQSAQKRMAAIDRDLQRLEDQGLFMSMPIRPGNEFPILLTRLPIFRPTRRRRQQQLQDIDNAIEFTTPFGRCKRYGPPLTVRDEDTLMALMRLRSRRLIGMPDKLPVSVSNIYETKSGKVGVHCAVCTVNELNKELGLTDGGMNFKSTVDSVKRLGATQLELELKTHDRYLKLVKTGRMLPLIQVQWQLHESDGLLVVLFPPVIAQWLDDEYTFIDWKVRCQLSDLGKAIHRFLTAQPRKYEVSVDKISETVGYDGPKKNVKQRFSSALDELIKTGWLTSYEFRGIARQGGLKLYTERAERKPDQD